MNAVRLICGLWVMTLTGCALGPDYQRPEVATTLEFRQQQGWKLAAPADTLQKGPWWQLLGDAQLNQLVESLNLDNQSLAASEARFRQAQALVSGARAAFFPQLGASAGKTRSSNGEQSGSAGISQSYNLGLNASWELDIWGKLRRNLQASEAEYQASEAELAALRLSLQSELARNYVQLRVLDEQSKLYEQSIVAFERSLKLTQNQYNAGLVPRSDVSQATTQLRSTQAQLLQLQSQRAQLEHAIAVLTGQPPVALNIAAEAELPPLPEIPPQLPASLLERRPDVAAAERAVMAANARIGVAKAAYFPSLALSATGGYRGSSFADWIELPNRYWSVGPQLALTLFDGGTRRAENERAIAEYDLTVANYRQTVLTGLQEVEDALVQLALLEQEAVYSQEALEAAEQTQRLVENQYKAGMVSFLNVANAQATALNSARSHLALQGNQLLASIKLISALGGDWQGLTVID